MLGGVGLDWEVIWIWLVVALSTDVLGYNFRAVPAAIMKRQISWTDPAISIVTSVFPVLGPRVDLLKERLFAGSVFQLAVCQPDDSWRRTAGFWIGSAALLTFFLPAPAFFWFETTRDLAAECWPAFRPKLCRQIPGCWLPAFGSATRRRESRSTRRTDDVGMIGSAASLLDVFAPPMRVLLEEPQTLPSR